MLHIVPILCLILFIGLVEYRLKEHLTKIDDEIAILKKNTENLSNLYFKNLEHDSSSHERSSRDSSSS